MEVRNVQLEQAGERTYIVKGRTNTGIYCIDDSRVAIIDTGFADCGSIIDNLISERGWKPEYIVNTHSHIDHTGGNKYFNDKYHIPSYMMKREIMFAQDPELEAAYMNGGYPARKLREGFARPAGVDYRDIEGTELKGIEYTDLPGHSPEMIGIRTDDGIWFTGDAYLSKGYLKNHMFAFIYQIDRFVESLEKLRKMEGSLFIPSHGTVEEDITDTIRLNLDNIERMSEFFLDICAEARGIDEILKCMFEKLNMPRGIGYYAMASSTARSFLSYLQDKDELQCQFLDNVNKWYRK
ncbi:MAG: MBL fold metallo-hydrolase [Bacillota bacterium]|nr:MBL fold metallo-hydrolase [Bacillota bacterium]